MHPPRWQRLLWLVALAQCCGSSCGDPRPTEPQPTNRLQVPSIATEQGSLRLRMRLSKPDLVVDCGTPGWSVPLSDALFGRPVELEVTTTPRPLYRETARPSSDPPKCGLVVFELDGAEPVVVRTSPGGQEYRASKTTDGKLAVSGASLVTVAKAPSARCEQRDLPTWSEATLTGTVLVEAIEPANEPACTTLRVRPAGTGAGGSLAWSICLGDAKVPFSAGDVLKIESNVHPVSRDRVLRIERVQSGGREPAERVALWLLRGNPSTLPAAGWDSTLLTLSNTQRPDGCGAFVRTGCGTVESGAQVAVQIEQRSMALEAGESAALGGSKGAKLEVHVTRAVTRPVVDPSCTTGAAARPVDMGVVVIERGPRSAPNAQVAAPQAR